MTYELISGRLTLNNPVIAASGTFGYGVEFAGRMDASEVGGVVCKGITLEPRSGHPPLRVQETAAGMLNAIGLANVGVEAIIQDKAPQWQTLPLPVIVNINGESAAEYASLAGRLDGVGGIAGIELNISCPNVAGGGMLFGADASAAAEVTRAVRSATAAPLLVKLTPNTNDIVAIAEAVVEAGAEALTVANTYVGMAINANARRPALSNVTGGLSGPAIKPLTLRLVYDIAARVSVPVVGCGGVMTGEDAVEYLMAGASAVQVGMATLVDPFAVRRVATELQAWVRRAGAREAAELIGAANSNMRRPIPVVH